MAPARFHVAGSTRSILPIHGVASVFMPWRRLDEIYAKLQEEGTEDAFGRILRGVGVEYDVKEAATHIPSAGPLLVVANHPFGILDGVIIGDLVSRMRPDVRILTNYLVAGVPELADHCISINPFESSDAISTNRRGVREALHWLRNGGALVMFPAGEVSHLRITGRAEDPEWMDTAARMARCTGADVLPVYFEGTNSAIFHALGMIHPLARTIRLPHEFVNARGKRVQMCVGSLVQNEVLRRFDKDSEATTYLRRRTYLLRERQARIAVSSATQSHEESIAAGAAQGRLQAEVARLSPESCLASSEGLTAYVASAVDIPLLLDEIGRLREVSFRAVGEGTGRSRDLDRYDRYYKHLFIWNQNKSELVGAYRFADCRQVLREHGIKGLYTSSLFRYDERFFERLGPAIELGRSFVRPEYQRHYSPLLMLWKGVARYVAQHPSTPTLFGAVSISNTYQRASRELLVRFFIDNGRLHPLSDMVKPRRPFRPRLLTSPEIKSLSRLLANIEELDAPICDLEAGSRSVPILLKQYLKLGGNVVGFNVDRDFSDAIDALVFVDLRQTDRTALKRYMGANGLRKFLSDHGIGEGGAGTTA
jgi:putative hemolysin